MNKLTTNRYTLCVKAGEMPVPFETNRGTTYLVIPNKAESYEQEVSMHVHLITKNAFFSMPVALCRVRNCEPYMQEDHD
jgi:hypothetical protein